MQERPEKRLCVRDGEDVEPAGSRSDAAAVPPEFRVDAKSAITLQLGERPATFSSVPTAWECRLPLPVVDGLRMSLCDSL
jgi:hypothetical protein